MRDGILKDWQFWALIITVACIGAADHNEIMHIKEEIGLIKTYLMEKDHTFLGVNYDRDHVKGKAN